MLMGTKEELRARKEALDRGLEDAKADGVSQEQAENYRGLLPGHVCASWRALVGDPSERVGPIGGNIKPEVQPVKARARRYDPAKRARS